MHSISTTAKVLTTIVLGSALAACAPGIDFDGNNYVGRAGDVEAVAKSVLTDLQPVSIDRDIMICGNIVSRPGKGVIPLAPTVGKMDECLPEFWEASDDLETGDTLVGSYVTFGSYHPDYDNELPSVSVLQATAYEGVPGYLATPGGKLWVIDADGENTRQVCGNGCLPSDPDFVPETGEFTIAKRYSLAAIQDRQP